VISLAFAILATNNLFELKIFFGIESVQAASGMINALLY